MLSAILAVIWAWIPLGLLFTGIGGIFALGLGVLALLVWVLVQQGANNAERYRAELIYSDKIPVPKIESSNREPGIGRFLHNRWLQLKSGAFWRSTAHHYIKMLLGLIVVAGTIAAICGSIFAIFAAINPHGVNTFFIGESIDGPARIGVAIGAVIVLASSLAILWFAPLLDRALDRALLAPARTVALQAEVTELDRARMAGIEAAAAERQRIERDLHDGAQPRLVALTMTLGMAKTKIDSIRTGRRNSSPKPTPRRRASSPNSANWHAESTPPSSPTADSMPPSPPWPVGRRFPSMSMSDSRDGSGAKPKPCPTSSSPSA